MVTGHRNEYTADTRVDQEGLREFRRLVRQRTLGSGHHAVWQRPALAADAALRGHARGPFDRKECERHMSMTRAPGLGAGYALFILIFYVTFWRAFIRIFRHRED
jgi:hypothetical protein